MTSRVLVADDSLTIQKVIGITLASSGYELVECLNESDLLRKIQSEQFDLVLLDFNLSDSSSGYDLSKQVHKSLPAAGIIVMLGTFDTIDESLFEECGISDKIVKPFESSKFVKKCREILEEGRPVTPSIKVNALPKDESVVPDQMDLWTVDAPHIQTKDEVQEDMMDLLSNESPLDPLSSEMKGWGFAPEINLEEKYNKVFPPVIEEASEVHIVDRLQSSSDFIQSTAAVDDLDATDPSFEVPEDLNRKLLNEIDEDISADAFWAVDEVVPLKAEEASDISDTNLDEVTADLTDTVEVFKGQNFQKNFFKEDIQLESTQTHSYASLSNIDHEEIVARLKSELRPMIEEMIKEFCRQSAEKVAWEVIPDLAENLIRKEIKEITESLEH